MKFREPPAPDYAFGYRERPVSGNEINGLGEEAPRRARQVFHNADPERAIAWQGLDDFFMCLNPWSVVRHRLINKFQLRRERGPVARRKRDEGPDGNARLVESAAREAGATLVGFTEVRDTDVFEGREAPYPHAVCLGLPMRREEMAHAAKPRGAAEVMRAYRRVAVVAMEVGAFIRRRGFAAKAYGDPNATDILHIPLAARAGLGQLGKHGSLISREHGSNFRLAAVLTEMPLRFHEPQDIAVDDVCRHCRRCVMDCPPDAIYEEKQWVRGEKRWYVDFDRCIPYFTKTFGCAICIEVCPWSEPGRGEKISDLALALRERRGGTPAPPGPGTRRPAAGAAADEDRNE